MVTRWKLQITVENYESAKEEIFSQIGNEIDMARFVAYSVSSETHWLLLNVTDEIFLYCIAFFYWRNNLENMWELYDSKPNKEQQLNCVL